MSTTYLITAATGIGAETARQLVALHPVEDTACIFFSSLTPEPCKSLRDELQASGAQAEYVVGDLTSPDFAGALVAAARERFGRLDALFNVAGISGRKFGDDSIQDCTDEGWAKTIETNLTTQFRMCRESIRVMLEQDLCNGHRGVILNMSSILAVHPEATYFDTVAYAASKGGILSMSRTMAASHLRSKIRVNAIAPALVATPMSARAAQDADILGFVARKQLLTDGMIAVKDAASACVFLLTDASQAITGQCLEVDAGWGLI